MLRGKPFHHFRGKLLYHFLHRRGVNKIFVLFPQVVDISRLFGHKKDLAEKSARSLLIFGFALLFISGFASNHSIKPCEDIIPQSSRENQDVQCNFGCFCTDENIILYELHLNPIVFVSRRTHRSVNLKAALPCPKYKFTHNDSRASLASCQGRSFYYI